MPRKNIKQTTQDFVKKAILIHGTKYDYSLVEYINSKTKVVIKCLQCGNNWNQTPSDHLSGKGCLKCSISQRLSNTQDFVKKAILIHGTKYDYSLVEYVSSKTKVVIKCLQCDNEFTQRPANHLRGNGCLKCKCNAQSSNTQEFIKKATLIHGAKYDYSLVEYVNAYIKILIKCLQCSNNWYQSPHAHLQGAGCPTCKYKGELILLEYLEKKFQIEPQKTFDWLVFKTKQRLDFFIKDLNIAIELQGQQHFQNVEFFGNNLKLIQERDHNKEQLLKQNKISIIYIYQPDVYSNKYNWQEKLLNSIEFIKNNCEGIWTKIEIGSIYNNIE